LGDSTIMIPIKWIGQLPYPQGEDIRGRIREKQKK
jgi:hypothetical protein